MTGRDARFSKTRVVRLTLAEICTKRIKVGA